MATFSQIETAKNGVASLQKHLHGLLDIVAFAEKGLLDGDGILDDVPLTTAQETSIVAAYEAKKAEIVAEWGNMP